jgi:hypothetical protein
LGLKVGRMIGRKREVGWKSIRPDAVPYFG